MKTFEDLVFTQRESNSMDSAYGFDMGKQSLVDFDNGYGVSVILGSSFYSNGIDTYELAILKDGGLCYTTPIADDVLGYLTEDAVTETMTAIQKLEKTS